MLPDPELPLCKGHHPMVHIAYTVKLSNGIEIPVNDQDYEICDNLPSLTPPIDCPLPSSYSGCWTSKHLNVMSVLKILSEVIK